MFWPKRWAKQPSMYQTIECITVSFQVENWRSRTNVHWKNKASELNVAPCVSGWATYRLFSCVLAYLLWCRQTSAQRYSNIIIVSCLGATVSLLSTQWISKLTTVTLLTSKYCNGYYTIFGKYVCVTQSSREAERDVHMNANTTQFRHS